MSLFPLKTCRAAAESSNSVFRWSQYSGPVCHCVKSTINIAKKVLQIWCFHAALVHASVHPCGPLSLITCWHSGCPSWTLSRSAAVLLHLTRSRAQRLEHTELPAIFHTWLWCTILNTRTPAKTLIFPLCLCLGVSSISQLLMQMEASRLIHTHCSPASRNVSYMQCSYWSWQVMWMVLHQLFLHVHIR